MTRRQDDADYCLEMIQKYLVGGRIESAEMTDEEELGEGFPAFLVECKDGKRRAVIVQRDPEGNGPGWLEIQEEVDRG